MARGDRHRRCPSAPTLYAVDERLRRPRLVGRTAELALLGALPRAASDGHSSACLIGGDAGCGKTRLVREFLASPPEDTVVLAATCFDGRDPPVPFAPLLEAFRWLPEAGSGPLPPEAPGSSPADVFQHVLTRLERLGRDRPVVLVLEDVHLADRATLDLFAFLAANLRASRTLVLATWCSELLPGGADLRHYVAGLTGDAGATRIDLRPLTRPELTGLLADAHGSRLDPATEAACWDRSEGNPFFGLELLGAVCRSGDPYAPLPDTLTDLLTARLDVLGDDARHVVRVAAAVGRRVDHRLLEQIAGLPAEELFAALHETVDRQVLVPADDGEGYRFRHALLHEAAYAQLLPGERRHILGRHADGLAGPPRAPVDIPAPRPPRLTPRELQVLSLVASGESNRTIAQELFISEKTASVHVSNILAKLGARSRTAAAAAAHRLGVLR
jgi:predicted ATPase/DNA-binding CsgD family transcriptional regulator